MLAGGDYCAFAKIAKCNLSPLQQHDPVSILIPYCCTTPNPLCDNIAKFTQL